MHLPAISMENPLLVKELRSRMRGARAYWILFAYLTVLGIALVLTYANWRWRAEVEGGAFVIGRKFFETLFFVQVGLVCLIAPGLTAGTITVEKEQRSYDLLAVTPMKARSIIIGKLISAISFSVLLVTSSLPLVSVCFLLGGVSPGEVFFAYVVLLLAAFMYGSIGMMWSAVSRNTSTATVATYLTVAIVFLGTLPLLASGARLQAVNPVGAFLYVVNPESYFALTVPAWVPSLILNGLAGILLVMIAVRKLDSYSVDKSVGLRVQSLLLCAALLFFVFGWAFDAFELGKAEDSWKPFLATAWAIALSLLLIATPIYATGERLGENKGLPGFLIHGWRRLFRSTLESGLPFLVLLVLAAAGLFLMGFPMSRLLMPGDLGWQLPVILLLVLSVLAAYGMAALLLSYVLRNRWAALMATYLLMAVFVLLPLLTLTTWDGGHCRAEYNPLWLTLYFNPYIGVISVPYVIMDFLPDPSGHGISFFYVTILVYALIASLAAVKLRHVLADERAEGGQKAGTRIET